MAIRVFFVAPLGALEHVPDRDVADLDTALRESVGQPACRNVRLLRHAGQDPVTIIFEHPWPTSTHLGRRHATGFPDSVPLNG